MSQVQPDQSDPRVQKAIHDLQEQIKRRYPDASFTVVEGDDPEGIYLDATVDVEDLDDVLDQELLDRLYDIQVEQGLPVYVLPLWSNERVAKELAKRRTTLDVLALPQSP